MKTLLTGATGFLGSAVLRLLVDDGQDVRVLARPNGARSNISGVKCEIVEGDLNDPESLLFIVPNYQHAMVELGAAAMRKNTTLTKQ